MAISSKSLFHFTSLNNLKNIIDKKYFHVRYSKETFKFRLSTMSYYIPMVCFCDIPLTQTREHIEHYNGYAIGLKRAWGLGHGLNPVFYITDNFTNPLEGLELGSATNSTGRRAFDYFFCLIKPYKGMNYKCHPAEEKNFYNEKEWRYVPMLHGFSDSLQQIFFERDFTPDINVRTLSIRDLYKLPFEVSDINYLIVKSSEEKKSLIQYLLSTDYATAIQNHDFIVFTVDEIFEEF